MSLMGAILFMKDIFFFFRFCVERFLETYQVNRERYQEQIQKALCDLDRDKKRIMEERGFKLEAEKITKTYRKKLPRSARKTFCK